MSYFLIFAVCFVVGFLLAKIDNRRSSFLKEKKMVNNEVIKDSVSFSVPEGWTFEWVANALVGTDDPASILEFEGITDQEKSTRINPGQMQKPTIKEALESLHSMMPEGFRTYQVNFDGSVYKIIFPAPDSSS